MPKPPEVFTPEQEPEFLTKLVGMTVTYAHFCGEHGHIIEFDDAIRRVVKDGQAQWFSRTIQ